MVNGQWSMVNGQWSMVNGQWSMVNEKLSELGLKDLRIIGLNVYTKNPIILKSCKSWFRYFTAQQFS
ncbi:MAG: hypothetical protein HW421_1118 [Ignavibacteria bacterium]|nr:hypothetical protein [Ignavibacteria bacterium]